MRHASILTVFAVAAAFAGPMTAPATAQEMADAGTLTVQNNRDVSVMVFVEDLVAGPGDVVKEVRIGTVPPQETATITIPAWAGENGGEVRAFLHPEGGMGDLVTETFVASPGTEIGTVVAPRDGRLRDVLPDAPVEGGGATLTVQNNRETPATVFVHEAPTAYELRDVRIGVVPARSTTEIALPSWVVETENEVTFFLHPAGGAELASEDIYIGPGSSPELMVPAM